MRSLLVALLVLFGASSAFAQRVQPPDNTDNCAYNTTPPVLTNGQMGRIQCDSAGNLILSASSGPMQVVGNVASGATDSGNPVKVGTKSLTNGSIPTFTTGQRADLISTLTGELRVAIANGTAGAVGSNFASVDAQAYGSSLGLQTNSPGFNYNGTAWDRVRSIVGAVAAGTGTSAVAIAPTSVASGGITPVVSVAAEGSHVLKASAGNFYSLVTTTGGTAGFVMVFNATSAPVDGAVTPVECVAVAANSTVTINYNPGPPTQFATGITAVFSSTGCFNKTISNTAFFSGKVS